MEEGTWGFESHDGGRGERDGSSSSCSSSSLAAALAAALSAAASSSEDGGLVVVVDAAAAFLEVSAAAAALELLSARCERGTVLGIVTLAARLCAIAVLCTQCAGLIFAKLPLSLSVLNVANSTCTVRVRTVQSRCN